MSILEVCQVCLPWNNNPNGWCISCPMNRSSGDKMQCPWRGWSRDYMLRWIVCLANLWLVDSHTELPTWFWKYNHASWVAASTISRFMMIFMMIRDCSRMLLVGLWRLQVFDDFPVPAAALAPADVCDTEMIFQTRGDWKRKILLWSFISTPTWWTVHGVP